MHQGIWMSRLAPAVRALANGDMSLFAERFDRAHYKVRIPARGILQLTPGGNASRRSRLLLSVGLHGDETAPIEMLAHLLDQCTEASEGIAPELLIVVGHPAAIVEGRRFLEADLNRMFCEQRGDLQTAVEAERADTIMRASRSFFRNDACEEWHLDLHTAIRPSLYPTFAVIPDVMESFRKRGMLQFLGRAGVGAAIFNPRHAGTYSAWTAHHFKVTSATIELGQAAALGSNDLQQFEAIRSAIEVFLRLGTAPTGAEVPDVYRVVQELIKHSRAFHPAFAADAMNFTAVPPSQVIAVDGNTVYRAGSTTEYMVFPNPDVRVGLRAGLMVVRDSVS